MVEQIILLRRRPLQPLVAEMLQPFSVDIHGRRPSGLGTAAGLRTGIRRRALTGRARSDAIGSDAVRLFADDPPEVRYLSFERFDLAT
jgi:hypothetical protein